MISEWVGKFELGQESKTLMAHGYVAEIPIREAKATIEDGPGQMSLNSHKELRIN